jgi:RNA polymerase sigma factor (sigma-70 family)
MSNRRDEINIEEYSNLVKSVVARYRDYGCSSDDLFQEGMIGLLEAKERFDENRGVTFATYAVYRVKKRIIDALNRERRGSMAAVPYDDETQQDMQSEGSSLDEGNLSEGEEVLSIPEGIPASEREILILHYQEKLTLQEISTRLSLSREKVRQLKQKALRRLKLTRY